jgi:hypothetical protein
MIEEIVETTNSSMYILAKDNYSLRYIPIKDYIINILSKSEEWIKFGGKFF